MWLKCDGRRREARDMAQEVVGDRSSGALWVTEEYLDFIPSAWEFMQKSEMLYLITLFVVLDWPESSFAF